MVHEQTEDKHWQWDSYFFDIDKFIYSNQKHELCDASQC